MTKNKPTYEELEQCIKELKKTEPSYHQTIEEIRDAKDYAQNIINSSLDMIIVVDKERRIVEFNKAAQESFGYSRKEILGKNIQILYADENEGKRVSTQAMKKGKITVEITNIRKNGETFPCRLSAAAIRDIRGEIIGAVGNSRDITRRKKAEKELKNSMEKLRRALEGTIQAMALTAEARDPYTAGHQRRVSNLACRIANTMNLSEDQIAGIRMAGLIHDIGKISIPAEILSKPGKLSDIEFSLIKTHPQVGYNILKGIEFPWPIALIILQHHENIDGSGYPSGLKGDEILLEAKILHVADVFEAIASHRPYRPALGIEKALEEISRYKGVLYDSNVIDACLRIYKENGLKFD